MSHPPAVQVFVCRKSQQTLAACPAPHVRPRGCQVHLHTLNTCLPRCGEGGSGGPQGAVLERHPPPPAVRMLEAAAGVPPAKPGAAGADPGTQAARVQVCCAGRRLLLVPKACSGQLPSCHPKGSDRDLPLPLQILPPPGPLLTCAVPPNVPRCTQECPGLVRGNQCWAVRCWPDG